MPSERPSLELRRAEPRDVNRIMEIDAGSYPTPWSRQLTAREVTGDRRIHLVAEEGFDVIGHGAVLLLAGTAHVSTIAVHPDHRRMGIGGDILLALVRGVLATGNTGLTLEVRVGNEPALALYRRFGFRPAGVRRGYYADSGEDAMVLWAPDFDDDYRRRVAELDYVAVGGLSEEVRSWRASHRPHREVPT